MTDTTPAALTPEELAVKLRLGPIYHDDDQPHRIPEVNEHATQALMIQGADLIEAQRAEIERLKGQIGAWMVTASKDAFRATTAEAAQAKHSEAQRAEIERLSERTVQVLHDFYLMTRQAEKTGAALADIAEALGVSNDSDEILVALSASLERERGMREAAIALVEHAVCVTTDITGPMTVPAAYVHDLFSALPEDERSRIVGDDAALAAKETTDGR